MRSFRLVLAILALVLAVLVEQRAIMHHDTRPLIAVAGFTLYGVMGLYWHWHRPINK